MKIPAAQTAAPARRWLWIAALLITFLLGLLIDPRALRELAAGVGAESGITPSPPSLTIDIPFANYNNIILAQRETALAEGVYIGSAADFQNGTMTFGGDTFPIELRLLQGLAVHLQSDDKWNFDVRLRDDRQLQRMTGFYLTDPADTGGVAEWGFRQSLRRDGILVSEIQFVQLLLNGDDRGLYALHGDFSPELGPRQARPSGVIVEFDPTPLWAAFRRAAQMTAPLTVPQLAADPVTNLSIDDFQFFTIDTFRDDAIAEDETLVTQQAAATGLLRALQLGELPAAAVFDAPLMGRFLALADLWGAAEAVSPLNLRFFYNPDTGLLEPVGYHGNPQPADLARRITLSATFNDPALQAAYMQALQEVTQPDYLTALQADLQEEWTAVPGAAAFFTDAFWADMAERQAHLRRSLQPEQPILAVLGPPARAGDGVIQIDLANLLNLPVEIVGFDIDGALFLPVDPAWLRPADQALFLPHDERLLLKPFGAVSPGVLRFARLELPLTAVADNELSFLQPPRIEVVTRLWGLETNRAVIAQPGIVQE